MDCSSSKKSTPVLISAIFLADIFLARLRYPLGIVFALFVMSTALSANAAPRRANGTIKAHLVTESDLIRRQSANQDQRMIHGYGKNIIVPYGDRLEFHVLPPELVFNAERAEILNSGAVVSPHTLTPKKIIWFSHPIAMPASSRPLKNVLACSQIFFSKTGVGIDDFCGIFSLEGQVLFRFPVKQKMPDQLLYPLAIGDDGNYAEVFLGKAELDSSEGQHYQVGQPREVLSWRFPDKFKRYPGPWHAGKQPKASDRPFDDMRRDFRNRAKEK